MAPTAEPRVLKTNVKRTVLLAEREEAGSSTPCVIKRYHSPGLLDRLRDGARARAEFRVLADLHRRGTPVPRPVAMSRVAGNWELVTEYIPDTVTLQRVMEGVASWPVPRERLLTELGRLLARVHAADLDHRDLHGGNVLVNRRGELWLVDLGKARLDRRLDGRGLQKELVHLAAGARELLGPRSRARFMLAYLRALPDDLRRELPTDGAARVELAHTLEDRARRRRRERVVRSGDRWLRLSGICRPLDLPETTGIARRDLDADSLRALTAIARSIEPGERRPFPGDPERIVVSAASPGGLRWSRLRTLWLSAARADDHGLGCARPLVLVRRPRSKALFELPRESRPLPDAGDLLREGGRRRILFGLGHALGQARDRGLAPVRPAWSEIHVTARGDVFLGPGFELAADEPNGRGLTLAALARDLEDLAGPFDVRDRATLAQGHLAANAHSARERAIWRDEIGSLRVPFG